MSQQERITDSLMNVIQAIQTGRGTGELRARKEGGPGTESGSLVFVNGQIVMAQVGSQRGMDAFNELKMWGRSVFIFTPSTPPPLPFQNSPALEPQRRAISGARPPTTDPHTPVPGRQTQDSALPLTAVPRATMSIVKAMGIIERAGLMRTYRRLILLIDGQRSVSELSLAMNCPPEDMRQMLHELEGLTIIRIVH